MVNLKLGFALLILVLSVAVVSAADWDRSYKQGKEALEQQNWPLAIQKFEEAIADNPRADDWKRIEGVNYTEYFPYFYLGIAYFEQGDVEAANGALDQAFRQRALPAESNDRFVPGQMAPSVSNLENLLAEVNDRIKEVDERIKVFQNYQAQAQEALSNKCYSDVVANLEQAKAVDTLRFERSQLDAEFNEASRLAQQGKARVEEGFVLLEGLDLIEAEQAFRELEKDFPCEPTVADGLDRIEQRTNDYNRLKEQAENDFKACRLTAAGSGYENAKNRHPQFAQRDGLDPRIRLVADLEGLQTDLSQAQLAFNRQDYLQASILSGNVVDWGDNDGDSAECYIEMAPQAKAVRQKSEARLSYQRAMDAFGEGKYQEADSLLERSVELDPDFREAGQVLEESQQFTRVYADAVELFQKGQELEESAGLLVEARGLNRERFTRIGGEDLLEAARGQVTDVAIERAIVLLYKGQVDTSIVMLERMARERPGSAEPQAFLGVAYATKAFLSLPGQQRDEWLEKAKEQFSKASALRSGYQLPERLVPLRILDLFREARPGS